MPAMLWPQPYTRPIAQPEPTSFRLPLRHFKTLPPPDAFHYRQADLPACMAEQGMDTAIAVPAIIPGQRDDVGRQIPFVGIIQIGRASSRERVCPDVEISVVRGSLTKQKINY